MTNNEKKKQLNDEIIEFTKIDSEKIKNMNYDEEKEYLHKRQIELKKLIEKRKKELGIEEDTKK